ncbi:hypothetical protein CCR75_009211 [Bremia lactucae]|uniref:Uncharacterized protein n=1 Tax=Bremia lactucae TaxID=4779 RepID=A0A976IIS1_BRELC|nr:hypothetical protein CCR75_009211 [Bremia lactucae]
MCRLSDEGGQLNAKAKYVFHTLIATQSFSICGCDDCHAINIHKCGSQSATTDRGATTWLSSVDNLSGWHRTSLSMCEEIVRKCACI